VFHFEQLIAVFNVE